MVAPRLLCSAAVLLLLCVYAKADVATQPAFSYDLAYNQLMYAYSAYCSPQVIQAWNCTYCTYSYSTRSFITTAVFYDPVPTGTFGYCGYQQTAPSAYIIQCAFRGLASGQSAVAYAQLTQEAYEGDSTKQVHTGFYEAYKTIRDRVRSEVARLIVVLQPQNITEVRFTGHNIGAAFATFAAIDVVTVTPFYTFPTTLYTFGSPRCGNTAFRDYVQSALTTVYRCVNQRDPFPHTIPPTTTLTGNPSTIVQYTHLAREVWWSTPSLYKVCDTTGEDSTCSLSVAPGGNAADDYNYLQTSFVCGVCAGTPADNAATVPPSLCSILNGI